MIEHTIGVAVLAALLATTLADEERLDRRYPFPPMPAAPTGALMCHPLNRALLECRRHDGSRFTCTPDPHNAVVCKGEKS